jgi:hypothetical protein
VIREFLQAVVDADMCMEINTSGLTKVDFEVHPDPLILNWARPNWSEVNDGFRRAYASFVGAAL